VDSFTQTDPPGYEIDVNDDGSVHITGNGMDETIQAGWTGSAQDWYTQNAGSYLPLPDDVNNFINNANSAATAMATAAAVAGTAAAEAEAVADFAQKVGEALTAIGALTAVFGFGGGLAGAGAAITAAANRAEAVADGVLSGAWQGLDTACDLVALSGQVQEARSVTDAAKSTLQSLADSTASAVADAVKGILNI
jgi:hypothetical protein